jgi:hypothetical protein
MLSLELARASQVGVPFGSAHDGWSLVRDHKIFNARNKLLMR